MTAIQFTCVNSFIVTTNDTTIFLFIILITGHILVPSVRGNVFLFGTFPASFFFTFVFSIQLMVHINFADDWTRTAYLWCRKRLLYPLHHSHGPRGSVLFCSQTAVSALAKVNGSLQPLKRHRLIHCQTKNIFCPFVTFCIVLLSDDTATHLRVDFLSYLFVGSFPGHLSLFFMDV